MRRTARAPLHQRHRALQPRSRLSQRHCRQLLCHAKPARWFGRYAEAANTQQGKLAAQNERFATSVTSTEEIKVEFTPVKHQPFVAEWIGAGAQPAKP